jgi:hypothetical protein
MRPHGSAVQQVTHNGGFYGEVSKSRPSVPKKLLEQFAYYDSATQSNRLSQWGFSTTAQPSDYDRCPR